MTYHELVAVWEARRDDYARTGALVDGVKLVGAFLSDLEVLQRAEATQVIGLKEAAERTGYSRGHLSRLLRQGLLPNAGRKGRPRIRVQDLPKSYRRHIAKNQKMQYDPATDARFVRTGQR